METAFIVFVSVVYVYVYAGANLGLFWVQAEFRSLAETDIKYRSIL
jgi:hypothetical protein